MTRRDNNANVIALSCRLEMDELKKIISKFLTSEYADIDRYKRRVDKINNYSD